MKWDRNEGKEKEREETKERRKGGMEWRKQKRDGREKLMERR